MPVATIPSDTRGDESSDEQYRAKTTSVRFDAEEIEYLERRGDLEFRDKSNLIKVILRAEMDRNPLPEEGTR